jgi:hypothetical protein
MWVQALQRAENNLSASVLPTGCLHLARVLRVYVEHANRHGPIAASTGTPLRPSVNGDFPSTFPPDDAPPTPPAHPWLLGRTRPRYPVHAHGRPAVGGRTPSGASERRGRRYGQRHQPGHASRPEWVVPEAADGQSADRSGSIQLPLLFSRPAEDSRAGGRPQAGVAIARGGCYGDIPRLSFLSSQPTPGRRSRRRCGRTRCSSSRGRG